MHRAVSMETLSTVPALAQSLMFRACIDPRCAKNQILPAIGHSSPSIIVSGDVFVAALLHRSAATIRRIRGKLHVGVDAAAKEIVVVDLTTSNLHDGRRLPELLERTRGEIARVSADRAYDSGRCYEGIPGRETEPTIPPRRRARLSRWADPPPPRAARDAVRRCIRAEGRPVWRTLSGATRRSLAESAVSRFKALVGIKLTARRFENQQVEARCKCQVLNRMPGLGLPLSEHVPVYRLARSWDAAVAIGEYRVEAD